jgi:DNA-binding transcriptional MerR regulator
VKKKYGERQLARILLISALRDGMQIDCIGELMTLVNGETEDEADDIISEDRLYDCFCLAAAQTEENPDWRGVIRSVVSKEQLAPEAENRLCPALVVMLHAYLAGVYRQRAAEHLTKLKESVQ